MKTERIQALEQEIYELCCELRALRKNEPGHEIPNYCFQTLEGGISLLDLFAGKDRLLAIHNMGQACRYCTLWGDGLNPFLPHLEPLVAVVMLSRDDPVTQRRFANSRGWRFRTASHGGGTYITEQSVAPKQGNAPGAVCYERRGEKIYRINHCGFRPGDLFCSVWHLAGLAGLNTGDWTPQYNYWQRPRVLDDGGENLPD